MAFSYVRKADKPAFDKLVAEMQVAWRGPIIERDGFACLVCGRRDMLDLAHITPKEAFYSVRGRVEDIALSFRADSLLTLDRDCHMIQENQTSFVYNSEIPRLINLKQEIYRNSPAVQELFHAVAKPGTKPDEVVSRSLRDQAARDYVVISMRLALLENDTRAEASKRRERIHGLFEERIQNRGWRHAYEVVLGSVPPSPPPVSKIATPPKPETDLDVWTKNGYVASPRCNYPGGRSNVSKLLAGQCIWGPDGCEGEVCYCSDCGMSFCPVHGRSHRRIP